jgi:hypothetical protein
MDETMNTEYKQHVLGLLKAMGPCPLHQIAAELITQSKGPWDYTTDKGTRHYHSRIIAIACLNELCREGKAELYDTGDAWDIRHE